jgi:hypothetical protein
MLGLNFHGTLVVFSMVPHKNISPHESAKGYFSPSASTQSNVTILHHLGAAI